MAMANGALWFLCSRRIWAVEKLLASAKSGGKRHALGTRRRRGLSADLRLARKRVGAVDEEPKGVSG